MTRSYQPPAIIKAIERLLVDVDRAVRTFARRFRYDLGGDLRKQAMQVFHLANKAVRDQVLERRRQWIDDLVWAIDDLKQYLQTAKLLGATRSFGQFAHLARQIEDVGRQAGGWKRQLNPKAQSAQADAHAQRGQKLSTRAASAAGANP
ncbi:MAG: four helix bundle protein [Dokdonella sp.]|uniref:four helix bundle protein n=1 Tax=Dokdonella sp. TaxID=2291710 RepID=UPI003F7E1765